MAIPPWLGARPREMALCASQPKGEKSGKDTHAYITLYQSFILAQQPIVTADSLLSQLKLTKCKLKCLYFADKLSHKLYWETFKIWCKHHALGDTFIISSAAPLFFETLWRRIHSSLFHHLRRKEQLIRGDNVLTLQSNDNMFSHSLLPFIFFLTHRSLQRVKKPVMSQERFLSRLLYLDPTMSQVLYW